MAWVENPPPQKNPQKSNDQTNRRKERMDFEESPPTNRRPRTGVGALRKQTNMFAAVAARTPLLHVRGNAAAPRRSRRRASCIRASGGGGVGDSAGSRDDEEDDLPPPIKLNANQVRE